MTIYYVDYKNGSDNAAGTSGAPWKTPAKALAVVGNGDTVRFRGSKTDSTTYYRASWSADVAGTTWENDTGHAPTWHGGYHTGSNDYGLAGTEPGSQYGPMIKVAAHNVTLRGLRVQNVGGVGFTVSTIKGNDKQGVQNVLITRCESDKTYGAAIVLQTGSKSVLVDSAEISYCTFTNMGLGKEDPDRPGGQNVQGSIQLLHCQDTHFHHNLCAYGHGEGINVGRGSTRSIVEYNVVHTMDHIHIAIVRVVECDVRYNVVYHTKHPEFVGGNSGPGAIPEGIRIGDEDSAKMREYPHSVKQRIYGNLIVGCSACIAVKNGGNFDSQMNRAYIGYNTCIGEEAIPARGIAATERMLDIQNRPSGAAHVDSLVENNIFYAPRGVALGRADGAAGVTFRNNAWYSADGEAPPRAAKSNSDVGLDAQGNATINPQITNPLKPLIDAYPNPATGATGFSYDNYRLKGNSPAIGAASNRSTVNNVAPPTIATDIIGATRTDLDRQNMRYFDIGALEYGGVLTNSVSAAFSGTPRSGNAPLSVAFSDLSSVTGAAVINSWAWTFGDGGTSTAQNPTRNYAAPGTYNVTLTVQDTGRGLSDAITQTAYITVGSPPTNAVTAAFSATPRSGAASLQVQFTDQSTAAGTATVGRWAWSFGDGGISTHRNPSYAYTTAGTYTVALTVYDDSKGLSDSETKTDYITVTVTDVVTANFTQSATGGEAPIAVTFTDTSTTSGATVIDRWVWEFGDGNSIEGVTSVPYIYSAAGTFTPRLTVYDTVRNLSSSKTGAPITVTAAPPSGEPGVVDVVRMLLPGTVGNKTIPFNLRGHAPALVLLFFTRTVAADTPVDDAAISIGAVTATEQWAGALGDNDAANPTLAKRYFTKDACLAAIEDGALAGLATRVSLGADNLTINVTDAFNGGTLTAVAFGGSQWQARAAEMYGGVSGTTTALNPGFEPEWYLFAGPTARTLGVLEDNADFMWGAAGGGTQMGYSWREVHNVTPTRVRSGYVTPGALFYYPNGLGVAILDTVARSVSFNAADFNARMGWVALDIPGDTSVKVEEFVTPTATGAQSYVLGFRPSGVLLMLTNHYNYGPQTTGDVPEAWSLVMADAGSTVYVGLAAELGAAAGNSKTVTGTGVKLVGPDGAVIVAGALIFTDDGFDIDWTTVSVAGRKFQVSAFSGAPSIVGPIPLFEADDTTPENGVVQFTDLSNPNGSPITGWYWTFGDGKESTEQHPLHTYDAPGVYTVFLQVTNANGQEHLFRMNYINFTLATHWMLGPYEPLPVTRTSVGRLYGDDPADPHYGFMSQAADFDALEMDAQPDPDIELSGRPGKGLIRLDLANRQIVVMWPDGTASTFSED